MSEMQLSKSTLSYTRLPEIKSKIERQREYFKQGHTREVKFRINSLKKLLEVIAEHEDDIMEAIHMDFRKSHFESFETEIGLVKSEIKLFVKNLKKWSSKKYVGNSIFSFPAKLFSVAEPLGHSLVISPWNYPFMLLFSPLVGSVAAGNVVLLKPSELTEECAKISEKIIGKVFDPGHVDVIQGAIAETQSVLSYKFDHIFFTGSTFVGKIIYQKAAENLTPVVLELGGKSPCIVHSDADIKTASKRIVWGKFLNGGQTCVAPDYLLIHQSVKPRLIEQMKKDIRKFYGSDIEKSPDYPRIINRTHFDRISAYLKDGEILFGGNRNESELYIEPSLIEVKSLKTAVMKEEIFGPVLPVLQYESILEIEPLINENSHPLALYVFSGDKNFTDEILKRNTSGDVCINDVVSHFGEKKFGVGGVGSSGIGKYHGKKSFDVFSHHKSILKRSLWPDLPFRYPPYKNKMILLKSMLNRL